MKQFVSSVVLLAAVFLFAVSPLCAAGCKVSCKNGSCEVTDCQHNAYCKCNFLGNPTCKCTEKGTIEEIGDAAGDLIEPK